MAASTSTRPPGPTRRVRAGDEAYALLRLGPVQLPLWCRCHWSLGPSGFLAGVTTGKVGSAATAARAVAGPFTDSPELFADSPAGPVPVSISNCWVQQAWTVEWLPTSSNDVAKRQEWTADVCNDETLTQNNTISQINCGSPGIFYVRMMSAESEHATVMSSCARGRNDCPWSQVHSSQVQFSSSSVHAMSNGMGWNCCIAQKPEAFLQMTKIQAVIAGKHLVKWSATLPVPRTCPICKIYFSKTSLNQFTLRLEVSAPSKSIFPQRESQSTRIGQTTSKLSSSDSWLTWTQCHRCDAEKNVKLWHTKLDRENRFQTSRAQSKPKPKTRTNVHVGRQQTGFSPVKEIPKTLQI